MVSVVSDVFGCAFIVYTCLILDATRPLTDPRVRVVCVCVYRYGSTLRHVDVGHLRTSFDEAMCFGRVGWVGRVGRWRAVLYDECAPPLLVYLWRRLFF